MSKPSIRRRTALRSSRSSSITTGAVVAAVLVGCATLLAPGDARAQADPPTVTPEQVLEWVDEHSNWGRWGDDDQVGTLNLITPTKRRAAAALVRDGVSVSLARNVSKEAIPENGNPMEHTLRWREGAIGVGLDTYTFSYHGYDFSHLDALPHFAIDGRVYNGYSTDAMKETGAEVLGIDQMSGGMFTRGVLVDIPRVLGIDYLEPGTPITVDDLEEWERVSGVTIEPGDVLLIRTGRWAKRAVDGGWAAGRLLAGLHASTAPWLASKDIAAVGCDGITDLLPSGVEGMANPLHLLFLVGLGTPIFDNLDLEAVAAEAAARDRWTFLFTAAPIRFTGGLGSPLNPLAVF